MYCVQKSFLINVPTGMGKTLASMAAAMIEASTKSQIGISILYISPLRSLTNDVQRNLQEFSDSLELGLKIAARTGDTSSYERSKLKRNPPDILLTTPESFNLMLTDQGYIDQLKGLRLLVVDEWHVLYSQKRGVMFQLNVSWLDSINPDFNIAILSATIGDPSHTAKVLAPYRKFEIISEKVEKIIDPDILVPEEVEMFPWRGHMGTSQVQNLAMKLDLDQSTLIFTNTRSQAEKWHQYLVNEFSEFETAIGLHHSSIERERREAVEQGLISGEVKWVVCTSSLDLGIDFPKVDRVVQIGSPKSIARIVQRAGRSGHRPGGVSSILFVPTHALEIFEYLALENALNSKVYEEEFVPIDSYDVLAQFMISYALLDGLVPEEVLNIAKKTYSFKNLTEERFERLLNYVETGGKSLKAYPQFQKLVPIKGRYFIKDKEVKRQHLMNMGTITSQPSIRVKFKNGKYLGTLEDSYVSKLKKGTNFQFAGKNLKYVLLKDTTLYVELSKSKKSVVPRWGGGLLPLSMLLCKHLREVFDNLDTIEPSLALVLEPLILAQDSISKFPRHDEFLIEVCRTKEGTHVFFFPFEGRAVHEGLAMLIATRFLLRSNLTFSVAINEYGLEVLGPLDWKPSREDFEFVLSRQNINRDLLKALEHEKLSERKFNEIAQIAGMIQQNQPGSRRTARNLKMTASLLYSVFERFEPENIFMRQAEEEVTQEYLNYDRLTYCLNDLANRTWQVIEVSRPTPLSFPLIVERISSTLSGEELRVRIEKLLKAYEKNSNTSKYSA